MHAKLDEVLDSDWNCLKEVDTEATLEVALCGNGNVRDKQGVDQHYHPDRKLLYQILLFNGNFP